jgi:hypothetical protein
MMTRNELARRRRQMQRRIRVALAVRRVTPRPAGLGSDGAEPPRQDRGTVPDAGDLDPLAA